MPLTDDEWRAFINLYNGVMDDVEAELRASLERNRLDLDALGDRGEVPIPEAEALYETLRESFVRIQDRLNAFGRGLLRLREMGEL